MKWVWAILVGLVGWLVYDWMRDKPGPVSDSATAAGNLMADAAGNIVENQEAKKSKKWLWILLGSLPAFFAAIWWFFFRKKKPFSNLFNLGYLGHKAPQGMELDTRYLAGCAKARRESLKMDFAKTQGATVAGLPITGVQATFGKKDFYRESYK